MAYTRPGATARLQIAFTTTRIRDKRPGGAFTGRLMLVDLTPNDSASIRRAVKAAAARATGAASIDLLHDVVSAPHLPDAKQIQRKNMKLAMSVGKNRHYRIREIQPRHFQQTAEAVIRTCQGCWTQLLDRLINIVTRPRSVIIATRPVWEPCTIRNVAVHCPKIVRHRTKAERTWP